MIDKFSSKKFRKLILSAIEYNLVLTATEIVLFLLPGLFHCIGEIHVLNGGSWHLTFCGYKQLVSTKLNPLYNTKNNNNMRENGKKTRWCKILTTDFSEDFVYISDNAYTKPQIRQMEIEMLSVLDFNLVTLADVSAGFFLWPGVLKLSGVLAHWVRTRVSLAQT